MSSALVETRELSGMGFVACRAPIRIARESLERIVVCHQARNAVLGYDRSEMANCPLAIKDATAIVRPKRDHLLVEIRSNDPVIAEEISRASRLVRGGEN